MDVSLLMNELKNLGSEQTLRTYRRHGITGEGFGVQFSDLEKITKVIKKEFRKDQAGQQRLAEDLWNTHNCDAAHLAMKILVPSLMTADLSETWISEFGFCLYGSILGNPLVETSWWHEKCWEWMADTRDGFRSMGYNLITCWLRYCRMKKLDPLEQKQLSKGQYEKILSTIESELHDSGNDARYAMNNALIAVGGEIPELTDLALQHAKKIGKVEVDHGDTSCKTPDAVSYIEKMVAKKESAFAKASSDKKGKSKK